MKINELMIGDWVQTPNGCRRVEELSSKNVIMEWHDYGCSVEDVLPIPLTDEILEKNGFKIVHGFGYSDKYPTWGWGYHNGIHDYCSIDVMFYDTPINGVSHLVKINRNSASGDGINTVHNCDIDYVHQLQHAIRLCGIEKEIEL